MRRLTHYVGASHRVDDIGAVFYYYASVFVYQRSRVIRLFAGCSMCLKMLILLGLSVQIALSSAFAAGGPSMLAIPTQTIVAQQLFTYRIVVDSAAQQPTGMRLINAPKGATLFDNGDNTHELRWTPPANVGEQTIIIVQAYSLAEPNLISTQRVVLQRGSAEQIQTTTSTAAGVVVASNNAIGSRLVAPSNIVAPSNTAKTASRTALASTTAATSATPATGETDVNKTSSTGYTPNFNKVPLASTGSEAAASNPRATPASNAESESIVSSRPELPELGLQRLMVGKEFQFFIRPVVPDNAQLQLSAQSLPVGATFEDVFEGSKMLRWTPTADQVGEHQMLLVLVAEDETDLSLRTEREVVFAVEPEPPVELAPMLLFEPMSAQIVSAGRKVNIRVDPIVSDEKIALLHVDRLPAGGSFDENKDGTRTFHWPTTQADQGEHTFRFTAIHPDDANLVANVNVLIVVGSPDGPGTISNVVATDVAPISPELDVYPSADSPSPEPYPSADAPSPESPQSVDSPSPEPYPTADTASPEPLAVRPPPQPRPTPD